MSEQVFPETAETGAGVSSSWRRRLWIGDFLLVAVFFGWSAVRALAGFEPTDAFPRLLLLGWAGVARPLIREQAFAATPSPPPVRRRVWPVIVVGALAVTFAQIF